VARRIPRRPPTGYTAQAAGAANTKVQQTIAAPSHAWNTGAGFVLGALADILLINYLKGGWPQVKQWLESKFTNVTPADKGAAATPAPPASGGGGGGTARPQ
jgi:hypothetical protein